MKGEMFGLIVITGLFFSFAGMHAIPPVYCAQDTVQCPDGSFVGRDSNNNCEFLSCDSFTCEDKTCNGKGVCGFLDPEIDCNPCYQTFLDSCDACNDGNVIYWEEGTCE